MNFLVKNRSDLWLLSLQQSEVTSVHSWYLTSFVILSFLIYLLLFLRTSLKHTQISVSFAEDDFLFLSHATVGKRWMKVQRLRPSGDSLLLGGFWFVSLPFSRSRIPIDLLRHTAVLALFLCRGFWLRFRTALSFPSVRSTGSIHSGFCDCWT